MTDQIKLLQEEKEYWQKEALLARAAAVGARTIADSALHDKDNLTSALADRDKRLELINELHRAVSVTGAPWASSHPGNLTVEALESDIARAREYKESPAAVLSTNHLVHVAWYHNGSIYLDQRKLSSEDMTRIRRLNKIGDKHKLYILDPK